MKRLQDTQQLYGIGLGELRRKPSISYYFRYPLHRHDFHDLRLDNHLKGYYAAKPLFGRLTGTGQVNRSAGYSGDVATLFVPLSAKSSEDAIILLAHMSLHICRQSASCCQMVVAIGLPFWKQRNMVFVRCLLGFDP